MAGTVVALPTSVVSTVGWTNTGGAANVAAACADALDTTYGTDTTQGATDTKLTFEMTDVVLPAGAALKSVVPKVRASQASTAGPKSTLEVHVGVNEESSDPALRKYSTPAYGIIPGATIQDFTCASGGALPNQVPNGQVVAGAPSAMEIEDYLKGMRFYVRLGGGGRANEDHRVYKCSVDVNYVDPPTTTGAALVDSGDLTKTTKPRFSWVYGSDDGMPQYAFRAAVWALADVTAYSGGRSAFEANVENIFGSASNQITDPTGTSAGIPSYWNGTALVLAKAWSILEGGTVAGRDTSNASLWTPAQALPATGAMVLYVQSSALYEGYTLEGPANWASLDFTMNCVPPAPPATISAVWQYPGATAPDNLPYYRTKVTVSIPAITTLSGFAGRRVWVEHQLDTDPAGTWKLMPNSVQEAGLTGGSYTFYDTMPLPGRNMRYRARTELWDTSYTLPSDYVYLSSRHNLVKDGKFDVGVTFWAAFTNANAATRTTAEGVVGAVTAAMVMTATAAGAFNYRSPQFDVPVEVGKAYSFQAQFKSQVTVRTAQIFIQWFQSDGTTLVSNSAIGQVVTTTTGWSTASLANVVAPANSAYARLVLQMANAAAGEVHWADGVIFEQSATANAYGDGDTASWVWGGVVDASQSFLPSVVAQPFDAWVLRDPLDPVSAVTLAIQGDAEWGSTEAMGEFRALGSPYPTFVSDAVMARRFPVPVHSKNEFVRAGLEQLRAGRRTLLLQSDVGMWAWVRFGPEVRWRQLRQPNRRTAPQHMMDFELLETWPIAGQPGNLWF